MHRLGATNGTGVGHVVLEIGLLGIDVFIGPRILCQEGHVARADATIASPVDNIADIIILALVLGLIHERHGSIVESAKGVGVSNFRTQVDGSQLVGHINFANHEF